MENPFTVLKLLMGVQRPDPVPTWAELETTLPESAGHESRELVRKATSASRHEYRVQQVLEAAGQAIRAEWPAISPIELKLEAWMLCAADGCGTGGMLGVGLSTPSTDRNPVFAELGTGRRHASDGPVWSAAIREAARRIELEVCAHASMTQAVFVRAVFESVVGQPADDEDFDGVVRVHTELTSLLGQAIVSFADPTWGVSPVAGRMAAAIRPESLMQGFDRIKAAEYRRECLDGVVAAPVLKFRSPPKPIKP